MRVGIFLAMFLGLTQAAFCQIESQWIEIRTSRYVLWMYKDPLRLVFFNRDGEELTSQTKIPNGLSSMWYETSKGVFHLTKVLSEKPAPHQTMLTCGTNEPNRTATVLLSAPQDDVLHIEISLNPPDGVQWVGDAFRAHPGEQFYGLEAFLNQRVAVNSPTADTSPTIQDKRIRRIDTLDLRGEKLPNVTELKPLAPSVTGTFLASSRGFGLWVDATTAGGWDLGVADPRQIFFNFAGAKIVYELYPGRTLLEVMQAYSSRTGAPWIPPDWAFGATRLVSPEASIDDLKNDIQQFSKYSIPWAVYEIPLIDTIPKLQDVVKTLNQNGSRVTMNWQAAALSSTVARNQSDEVFIPGANHFLDVTHPNLTNWYRSEIGQLLEAGLSGLTAMPLDDPLVVRSDQAWSDGRTVKDINRTYTPLLAKTVQEALNARREENFFLLFPCGFNGVHRYAAVYQPQPVSTLDRLQESIVAVQRAALMGYPVWRITITADAENFDREALMRALQVGAFLPLCAVQMETNPNRPLSGASLESDRELRDSLTQWAVTREMLAPYFQTSAGLANESGRPIVTPMVMATGYDGRSGNRWDQFLVGDALLVAPILHPVLNSEGVVSREIFLPLGIWRPAWNLKERLAGGVFYEVDAVKDEIPVMILEGSVIPLRRTKSSTALPALSAFQSKIQLGRDFLTCMIVPDAEGTAAGSLYQNGKLQEITCKKEEAGLSVAFEKLEQSMAIQILLDKPPKKVLSGSTDIPAFPANELSAWEEAWYFEADSGWLWIKADRRTRNVRIEF